MKGYLRFRHKAFRYKTLATPTAFRLLELLPGQPEDIIKCRLTNSDLQEAPQYSALSYEWDLIPGHETINVNGRTLQVRRNLAVFLRVIRAKSSLPTVIWADAICIDQENVAERGHQVQLMRKIFMNATEVKSWLGPSTPGIDQAIAFCNEVSRNPFHQSFLEDVTDYTILEYWMYPNNKIKYPDDELLIDTWARARSSAVGGEALHLASRPVNVPSDITNVLSQIREGVSSFCSLTYWTRLWVMPEILLGKTVLLHCGLIVINLDILVQALAFLDIYVLWRVDVLPTLDHGVWPGDMDRRIRATQLLIRGFVHEQGLRRSIQDGSAVTLPQLLRKFGAKHCLHHRDRVYALAGIVAAHDETLPIDIDYTATTIQVFFSTIDYCVRNCEWEANDFEVLRNSLDLKAQDCLTSLFDGSSSRISEAIYHRPFLRVNLFQLANIANQARCGPLARCGLQSTTGSVGSLVVNTPVEVGDNVFASLHCVVICRDNSAAEIPQSRRSTLPTVVAWGKFFHGDDPELSDINPLWPDHCLEGRMEFDQDIASEKPVLRMTLSVYDLLILASFPGSRD